MLFHNIQDKKKILTLSKEKKQIRNNNNKENRN